MPKVPNDDPAEPMANAHHPHAPDPEAAALAVTNGARQRLLRDDERRQVKPRLKVAQRRLRVSAACESGMQLRRVCLDALERIRARPLPGHLERPVARLQRQQFARSAFQRR